MRMPRKKCAITHSLLVMGWDLNETACKQQTMSSLTFCTRWDWSARQKQCCSHPVDHFMRCQWECQEKSVLSLTPFWLWYEIFMEATDSTITYHLLVMGWDFDKNYMEVQCHSLPIGHGIRFEWDCLVWKCSITHILVVMIWDLNETAAGKEKYTHTHIKLVIMVWHLNETSQKERKC